MKENGLSQAHDNILSPMTTQKSDRLDQATKLLEIRDLKISYKTYRGDAKVVDGICLNIARGEKIGLVGESGCGKTTTMKTILRLLPDYQIKKPDGKILFNGNDILQMSQNELLQIRRKSIAMVSQEPMAALNPVFSVGQQMGDVIKHSNRHSMATKSEIRDLCLDTIANVLIPDGERILKSYPHQLSGGMRQRICIAMALLTQRDLIIADEPGTALDVTIQDQIHKLLHNLTENIQLALIMITHSLGVARELVDRIYIMYAGTIVETANTKDLLRDPRHPYSIGLMECVPRLSGGGFASGIYGYVPDYVNAPQGCRFSARCPYSMDICKRQKPQLTKVDNDHFVACFRYENHSISFE